MRNNPWGVPVIQGLSCVIRPLGRQGTAATFWAAMSSNDSKTGYLLFLCHQGSDRERLRRMSSREPETQAHLQQCLPLIRSLHIALASLAPTPCPATNGGVHPCSRSAIVSTDNDHLIAGRGEGRGERLEKVTDKSVNNKRLFRRRRL